MRTHSARRRRRFWTTARGVAAVFLANTPTITVAQAAAPFTMRLVTSRTTMRSSCRAAPIAGIALDCGSRRCSLARLETTEEHAGLMPSRRVERWALDLPVQPDNRPVGRARRHDGVYVIFDIVSFVRDRGRPSRRTSPRTPARADDPTAPPTASGCLYPRRVRSHGATGSAVGRASPQNATWTRHARDGLRCRECVRRPDDQLGTLADALRTAFAFKWRAPAVPEHHMDL
jgi:hypothetical protein